MSMRHLLGGLLLLLLAWPVEAVTRYVSQNGGSNSNSCTDATDPSKPKQTVGQGMSCTAGGDTLIVRGGTGGTCTVYAEGGFTPPSGSASAPTVIRVQTGECVHMRPNNGVDYIFNINAGRQFITIEGFKLDGGSASTSSLSDRTARLSAGVISANSGTTNITIRNNEMMRARHSCLFVEESTQWLLEGNTTHHCGWFCCNSGCPNTQGANCDQGPVNPDHVDELTGATSSGDDHGWYIALNHSTFRGNTFHHNPAYSFQIYGSGNKDNNIIENNVFSTSRCGITMQGTGHIVRNNIMYNDGHNEELGPDYSKTGCASFGQSGPTTDAKIYMDGGGHKVLNNTLQGHGIADNGGDCGSGCEVKNNIVCAGGSTSGVTGGGQIAANLTGTCPGFFDAGAGNFRLTADDTGGQTLALVPTDFDGNPRTEPYSRGAFEFGGTPPPPPPPPGTAGPLVVHPTNPRYFQDAVSGKAVFLTGSSVFCNLQQFTITVNYEACTQDYTQYLDFLQARQHNFMRLWRYDLMGADVLPWPRTGPGTGFNGQQKLDLNQFDAAFFTRLRQRVVDAGARGMYVAVMLFDGAFSESVWSEHPLNPTNNIQGIDGGVNNTQTETNSAKLTIQENYIKHVVDTLNDLDNYIYEISNESVGGSLAWQQRMANLIQSYEGSATNPKRHAVGITSTTDKNDTGLFATTNTAWIAPGNTVYRDNPPASTGQKVVITDTDHIGVGNNSEANTPYTLWTNVTRGNSFIIMEPSNCPLCLTDTTNEPVRRNAGQARTYLDTLPLASMTPQGGLSSTAYALAQPGVAYLVFQPGSGQFTLQTQAATYDVTWWNVNARTETAGGSVALTTGTQTMTPPFSGPAVLVLAAPQAPPPAQSLIAYWKLDEGTGTTAADFTGNGHTGTLAGSPLPAWVTGKVGPFALQFNGSNSMDTAASFTDPAYSWALWVKGDTAPLTTADEIVLANGIDQENTWSFGWSSTTARFRQAASHRDGTGAYITAQIPDVLSGGVWYHIGATYDGANLKIYLNGTLRATSPVTSLLSPSGIFRLGKDKGASFGFPGAEDDVRIYNFALNQAQMQELAGTTPPVAKRPRHQVVMQ